MTKKTSGISMTTLAHWYYVTAILTALLSPWLYLHIELSQVKTDIAVIKQEVYDHIHAGESAMAKPAETPGP
jgi:hypothetical protein